LFKAALFDYDGVIVQTMSYHLRAWQAQFDTYGIKISPYDVLLREGSMAVNIGRKIFEQHGVDIPDAELKVFVAQKQKKYRALTEARVSDSVPAFIAFLKERKVSLGLVTGTDRSNVSSVISDALLGQFQTVVTSENVTVGKPHPEPYLMAASALAVRPADCLVVENAPMGIASGKRAGMTVVALQTTLARHYLAGADYYFQDVADLHKNWSSLDSKANMDGQPTADR
jgi:beta-phosphoglucomutase